MAGVVEGNRNLGSLVLPVQEYGLKIKRLSLQTVKYSETVALTVERPNPFARAIDVRPLLEKHHPFWRGELMEVARQAPDREIVGGSVATSMVPSDFSTYYRPTNGLKIQRELPWLLELFQNDFQYLVQKIAGDPTLALGTDLAHSLNMNFLQEGGYEMHVDRNPITALLAAETMYEGEGGLLRLYERVDPLTKQPAGTYYDIPIQAGILYIFNGHLHPHEVTSLRRKNPRLVVPGDYYSSSAPQVVDDQFNALVGVGDPSPS